MVTTFVRQGGSRLARNIDMLRNNFCWRERMFSPAICGAGRGALAAVVEVTNSYLRGIIHVVNAMVLVPALLR
jgi:hypothetical protein